MQKFSDEVVRHKREGRLEVIGMRVRKGVDGEEFHVLNHAGRMARLTRRVTEWAHAVDPLLSDERFVMKHVTLTYRPGEVWEANDRAALMMRVRARLKDGNIAAYAIVAELQKRGVVHYHLMMIVKRGTAVPYFDESGLWLKGDTGIRTRTNPWYLIAYAKKETQKTGEFPKGCRIGEEWVNEEFVDLAARWRFRLSALPKWVRDECVFDMVDWPRAAERDAGYSFRGKRVKQRGYLVGVRFVTSPYTVLGPVYEHELVGVSDGVA